MFLQFRKSTIDHSKSNFIWDVGQAMWNLSDGDRILTPEEWRCIRIGLTALYDTLRQNRGGPNDFFTGIEVFDNLTPPQQFAQLAGVCHALTDEQVPAPELTAANEGTLAALLQSFCAQLEIEIDFSQDDEVPWLECRRALIDALRSDPYLDDDFEFPEVDDDDIDAWDIPLQSFQSRFLEDEDYLMNMMLDIPADDADALKENMGIDSEYYVSVVPEPTEGELVRVHQQLCQMLDLPSTDENGKFPALFDRYSGLSIGPCTQDEIDNWSHNHWIDVQALTNPDWDCEFAVWKSNFARALLDADPNLEASADFAKQQLARREAAMNAIGIPF